MCDRCRYAREDYALLLEHAADRLRWDSAAPSLVRTTSATEEKNQYYNVDNDVHMISQIYKFISPGIVSSKICLYAESNSSVFSFYYFLIS